MERRYCDVCGGIVAPPAESGADILASDGDDALICDVCVRTRRVFPEGAITPADERAGIAGRFRCPHCDRRLKTRTIKTRTEVDCPRCKGKLVLLPDGRVEAGLPSWPRQPGADADDDGDDDDGPGGAGKPGARRDEAPSAVRVEAPVAAQRATQAELPSDLSELLATSEAFAARAESDSTEMLALEGRSSKDSGGLAGSSGELPAAPSFAPHTSGEAPRAVAPAPAPRAVAPAPAPRVVVSAPAVPIAAPTTTAAVRASTAAPLTTPRAPWVRVGVAAALLLGGVTGASLLQGSASAPRPLTALGERIAKGFLSLEARLR